MPPDQQITFFKGGTVLLDMRQNTWWNNYYTQRTKSLELGAIAPPAFDGKGTGKKSLSSGCYTITAIKKAGKSRIEEILRVMNYTAAPFGTEEYVFCRFGSPGADYAMIDGPQTNRQGRHGGCAAAVLCRRPPARSLHHRQPAGDQERLRLPEQGGAKRSEGRHHGLASDTYSRKNSTLQTPLSDMISQVVQGRKSLGDWDSIVKRWRSEGGDAMAKEYAESFTAAPH